MTTQTSYTFRGFVYSASRGASDWSARLCHLERRVARVVAKPSQPVAVEFDRTRDRLEFEQFIAQAFPGEDIEEAGASFLAGLADQAYHRRRLQVVSLRHTVFRLADDPPDRYRYLQGIALSAEVVGKLRLTYGRRLLEVMREETLPREPAKAA